MDSHKAFCQQDRIYIILRKQAQFEIAPEEEKSQIVQFFLSKHGQEKLDNQHPQTNTPFLLMLLAFCLWGLLHTLL